MINSRCPRFKCLAAALVVAISTLTGGPSRAETPSVSSPPQEVPATTEAVATLEVMLRSANSVRDLYTALTLLYNDSDIKHYLPVRIEEIAKLKEGFKGPVTFCTLMAQDEGGHATGVQRSLASLLSACPQTEVNRLWKVLGNPGNPEDLGKSPIVYLPEVVIRSFLWRRVVNQTDRNPKEFYGHLINKQRSSGSDYVAEIIGLIFQIRVKDIATAERAATLLEEEILSDIVVDVIEPGPREDIKQRSRPFGDRAGASRTNHVNVPSRFWQYLPWRTQWTPPASLCLDNSKSAIINLVDQAVELHPDFGELRTETIQGTVNPDETFTIQRFEPHFSDAPATEPACRDAPVQFDRRTQHGTHLAAIMVSRNKNFIGRGCASPLRVIDINTTRIGGVQSIVQELLLEERPQVFVSASLFPANNAYICPINQEKLSYSGRWVRSGQCELQDGGDDLRTKNSFVKLIEKQRPLWITAAGQTSSPTTYAPFRLSALAAMVPMNLGDYPSVIVVTACDPCGSFAAGNSANSRTAELWPDSYYSIESSDHKTSFVHLAAPGVGIVAPVTPGRCAEATGTSQAAAFVGGVAAAMINFHTSTYFDDKEQPRKVRYCRLKRRLQVTSAPILKKPEDLRRVASGIVDPAVALLDPEKVWFCKITTDNKTRDTCHIEEYTEIEKESFSWCVKKYEVANDDQSEKAQDTRSTLRIFRLGEVPETTARSSTFMIYVDPHDGESCNVYRRGPRMLQIGQASGKLFQAKIGGRLQSFMLDDLKDIILPEEMKRSGCL